MKTLFFSDVHLMAGDPQDARMKAFVAFLRSIDEAEYQRIILLGDLFDFWFEYRHVIFSGYFDVLRAFAELGDRGIEIHLAVGNHDFWAGRFLHDHLGVHIHRDPFTLDFGGKRALLLHGDGLNPKDVGYRVYKRFARAWPVIALFRMIHPDLAMRIAQGVSRSSRRLTKAPEPCKGGEAKALRVFAKDVLSRGEADVVICGHAHAPALEEHPKPGGMGLYINTGDWMHHHSYVSWDGERFELHSAKSD